ncbi:YHS domain-containing protein [Aeoliella sp.]|uniref:YHS domain-containing protein n=1 Tax=Aeoliella sp. TaxID=2795800 RepID=UPI003CCBBA56
MSDIATFTKRVHEVVTDTCRLQHWSTADARRYMQEIRDRRQIFDEKARTLLKGVIQPRLTAVAGLFPNASCSGDQSLARSCHFQWTERFPANASVAFSVEHDLRFEQLIIRSHARIVPRFIPLVEQDQLHSPLQNTVDASLADWVEERLLEFIDTYLRLDCQRQSDIGVATDPVCGMKLSVAETNAASSYYGHPYYFCSEDCHSLFERDPARYAQVKTT